MKQPSLQQAENSISPALLQKKNFEVAENPQLERNEDFSNSSGYGQRDVIQTDIRGTSPHASHGYFTRSRGPVPPVPHIMAAPLERKKYTRVRRS